MAPRGSRARSQLPHASIVWLCLCNAAVGLFVVCYLMVRVSVHGGQDCGFLTVLLVLWQSQLGGHGQDVAKASGRVDTMRPRDKAPLQVKRGASVSTSRATLLFGDKRDGADLEDDFANCHSLAMPVGLDGFSVADEDSRTLRYNVTVTDRLVEDGYHFFSVCVVPHKLDQLLTVKLDSLSGDADLCATVMCSCLSCPRPDAWLVVTLQVHFNHHQAPNGLQGDVHLSVAAHRDRAPAIRPPRLGSRHLTGLHWRTWQHEYALPAQRERGHQASTCLVCSHQAPAATPPQG